MSVDPQMLAQLLMRAQAPSAQSQAYQNAQAPGQMAMGMGNVATGTNVGASATNALSKLALALMQRKRMQDYQKQYGTPQVPTQAQGQTLSGPVDNSSAPTGMMGPP